MISSALLTFSGRDRPGIVARATQVLFESGCNIADSSMTRLGGEFIVMLILHLPADMTTERLAQRFQPLAEEMTLAIQIRPLSAAVSPPLQVTPSHAYTLSVLGADQPGIVFRVTQLLAETGCNITDLYTQIIGTPEKPVYSMVIEVESNNGTDLLQHRLTQLEKDMNVEIVLRSTELSLM